MKLGGECWKYEPLGGLWACPPENFELWRLGNAIFVKEIDLDEVYKNDRYFLVLTAIKLDTHIPALVH